MFSTMDISSMLQKHDYLYCVSPETGKWWIRRMLFTSVLTITELVSPVLLRRFDQVWLCSLRYNVRQQRLISFTITSTRPSDQYDSVVWLLTFIKSKSVYQANSNRISHKKLEQKIEFPLCGHEFYRTEEKFRKQVRATECKQIREFEAFYTKRVKKKKTFFFFNKWCVKGHASENLRSFN